MDHKRIRQVIQIDDHPLGGHVVYLVGFICIPTGGVNNPGTTRCAVLTPVEDRFYDANAGFTQRLVVEGNRMQITPVPFLRIFAL